MYSGPGLGTFECSMNFLHLSSRLIDFKKEMLSVTSYGG